MDVNRDSRPGVSIQQMQNDQVDVFVEAAETLGYYATKKGAQIQLVGPPFGKMKIGAATLNGNTGLHDAMATSLADAIVAPDNAEPFDDFSRVLRTRGHYLGLSDSFRQPALARTFNSPTRSGRSR